jgi:hypothetical protein
MTLRRESQAGREQDGEIGKPLLASAVSRTLDSGRNSGCLLLDSVAASVRPVISEAQTLK